MAQSMSMVEAQHAERRILISEQASAVKRAVSAAQEQQRRDDRRSYTAWSLVLLLCLGAWRILAPTPPPVRVLVTAHSAAAAMRSATLRDGHDELHGDTRSPGLQRATPAG